MPQTETPPAPSAARRPPVCVVIVQRQLEDFTSGNASYLGIFLEALRAQGFRSEVLFAPERSFGNRPWAGIHPRFRALADGFAWPRAARIGGRYLSLSGRVYARFALRLLKAALQKLGVGGEFARVHSYLGDPLRPREAEAVLARLRAHQADLVVAEYSALGPLLAGIEGGATRAVLMHDMFSRRAEAMRKAGRRPDFLEVSVKDEAARCAAADALFYASATEAETLRPLLPRAEHIWVRPDVGVHAPPPPEGAPRAVYLGTRHAGNIDAIEVLMEEIWPRVAELRPGAELWIAGSIGENLPDAWRALPGVKVLGRVGDLSEIGGERSVGLAPTRAASGVSIKVAEFLRLGMATVAMPMALEGFGGALDHLCVVAEGPEDFAGQLTALLADDDRRQALARRGFEEIGPILSNAELQAFLGRIAGAARPEGS